MTCRHAANDPSCSSHKDYRDYSARTQPPATPDSSEFEIIEVEELNPYLVLKVKYPNCSNCSFEGTKILVIQATLKQALLWKKIDPHFKDNKLIPNRESPSPIARFPASDSGWKDALAFVKFIISK